MVLIVAAFALSLASLIGADPVPSCICTMEYMPVCGVDGKTYGNKCGLTCAGVQLDYPGECQKPTTPKPQTLAPHVCVCPRIYMPVCGKDGVTYANQCEMNCANVAILQDGPCPSTATHGIQKRAVTSPCFCTFIYLPVCGSDGITYGNQCNLDCAARSVPLGSPKLTKIANGPCGVSTKAPISG